MRPGRPSANSPPRSPKPRRLELRPAGAVRTGGARVISPRSGTGVRLKSASREARARAAAGPGTDRWDGWDDETVSPWRGTKPELVIAAVLAAAAGVAGYVMAGWAGLSAVVIVAAAIALAVLRTLLPKLAPDRARTARKNPTARPLSGYARRRFVVQSAMSSLAFYNDE